MVTSVNPPPLQVPAQFLKDKLTQSFFSGLISTIYQLWTVAFGIRVLAKVRTTDATSTVILRIPVADGHTTMISAAVVARRTGGTGPGTIGQSAWYQLNGAYNNTAGVLTGVGTPSLLGGEDVAAWDIAFSSIAAEVVITVQGVINNDITWQCSASTYDVSI
jgi:hypothetical protein